MKINVVLFQPEIPQNTGNISRTCSATGSALHLVHPLGFSLDERHLRRAGLDYWDGLEIHEYESDAAFFSAHPEKDIWYFSQKGALSLWEADAIPTIPSIPAIPSIPTFGDLFSEGEVWLAFGRESRGLDESLLLRNRMHTLRIPMLEDKRSLNLSNCVAVAVYEILRRTGFDGLKEHGKLNSEDNAHA